ncbi:hypothetical protein [Mumia sp. ZJ430]|uniref:hypothetical protein n=1 Tax=Mumia sp. ZJ430 TaxID=2708083 RepID=UPI00141E7659|nr:hypothetical protein [Mumia sp. ZJ430]
MTRLARRVPVVFAAVAATAVVATAATAATAATLAAEESADPGSEVNVAGPVATEKFVSVNDALDALREKYSGFAGASNDLQTMTTTVRWKGTVPNELRKLERSGLNGITVTALPAAYSQEEINLAADAAIHAPGAEGTVIGAVGTPDRSGLIVEVTESAVARLSKSALSHDVKQAIAAAEPQLETIPVTIRQAEPTRPAIAKPVAQ